MKNLLKRSLLVCFFFTLFFSMQMKTTVLAQNAIPMPRVEINFGSTTEDAGTTANKATNETLQLMFLVVLLSLAPSLLMVLTAFTRIIIVFHFLRSALGTQQMPPNQVMIGLAFFLTIFLMGPTFTQINETALKPLAAAQITQDEAITIGMEPIREFMFRQVKVTDLALFSKLANQSVQVPTEEISNAVLIPAFILGEISVGFKIGFLIYMPFIVIDMVVASVLMAMGMMMLPPAMISLPFKILLFVMVDGWNLLIQNLIKTFK